MILGYSDPEHSPNMKQTIPAFPFTLEYQISFLVLSLSTLIKKREKNLATMEWLKHEFYLQIYSFLFLKIFFPVFLPFSQCCICVGSLTHY